MIEVDFSAEPLQPVDLQLHTTKGASTQSAGAPSSLCDLLSIGLPQVRPLDPQETRADCETRRFLDAEQGRNTYTVVLLRCSFNPSGKDRIVEALLQVDLAGADDTKQIEPIAWSLDPQKSERPPLDSENTLKIGSDLKFIKAEYAKTIKSQSIEALIEAHNEFCVNPYWKFRETTSQPLTGNFRLGLIIQSPAGITVTGTLSMSATVRRLAMHVFPYKASLGNLPVRSFAIT
jgi:hypothetical protein